MRLDVEVEIVGLCDNLDGRGAGIALGRVKSSEDHFVKQSGGIFGGG